MKKRSRDEKSRSIEEQIQGGEIQLSEEGVGPSSAKRPLQKGIISQYSFVRAIANGIAYYSTTTWHSDAPVERVAITISFETLA